MPKSKHRRKKKQAATVTSRSRASGDLPSLPDRRALEGLLAEIAGGPRTSALDAAQGVMYEAWDAGTKRERVRLARKALEISALCADAYVLLAEETARGVDAALDLYRRAVEAGESALGTEAFEEDVGYFWGILKTRPYMRARRGLALALWAKGEREEALGHYRDMLRLNPNDNQGVRYLLAGCLLDLERDEDLTALLKDYEEDGSAVWTYTRALVAFRRDGDCDKSRGLLAAAVEANCQVPNYLLGAKRLSRSLAAYITWGGEDEASDYASENLGRWAETAGALAWLRRVSPSLPKSAQARAGT